MKERKPSTKFITCFLITILSVVGVVLAIPGIVSQAENERADKTKTEITEINEVAEPFSGEKSDSVDENIMKSEMEWGSGSEEQEEENKEDEPSGDEEQTTIEEEPYSWETDEEENPQTSPDEGQSQNEPEPSDTPDTEEGENNSPTEPVQDHIHVFSDWVTTLEPTCIADGTQTRTCSSCGENETMAIPAVGHTWREELEIVTEFYCGGCEHVFGPNSSEEERYYHQMNDENGNPRDEEGQKLHTAVSKVRKYRVCNVCEVREEVQ